MFALDQFKIEAKSESKTEGVFEISPLPRGYGQTLGNTLRRILLSSIPGTAVTAVKVEGVEHEYSTLADVQDDVLAMVLRFKNLPLHSNSDTPVEIKLSAKGKKGQSVEVTAADIAKDAAVEVIDPTYHVTNLSGATALDLTLTVERGVGYVAASEDGRKEMGLIPLDSNFSPVINVAMEVTQTRVGQMTDLDKITLTITTNGSVKPSVVLHQAVQAFGQLADHLLTEAEQILSAAPQSLIGTTTEKTEEESESEDPLNIVDLGLSNRVTNALLRAGYTDLRELEGMAEEELGNIKGMGAKSLAELKEEFVKYDITHI